MLTKRSLICLWTIVVLCAMPHTAHSGLLGDVVRIGGNYIPSRSVTVGAGYELYLDRSSTVFRDTLIVDINNDSIWIHRGASYTGLGGGSSGGDLVWVADLDWTGLDGLSCAVIPASLTPYDADGASLASAFVDSLNFTTAGYSSGGFWPCGYKNGWYAPCDYHVSVAINPPCAVPTCNAGGPYVGSGGVPVLFSAADSYDIDGTIVAYDWDFGDGQRGSGMSVTHTYPTGGDYTVGLCLTDSDGRRSCCSVAGGSAVAAKRCTWGAIKDRYR